MIRMLGNYNPESFVQHQTVLIVWYLRGIRAPLGKQCLIGRTLHIKYSYGSRPRYYNLQLNAHSVYVSRCLPDLS